jgi:hypothetical protein
MATSYGLMQIMGFNYRLAGFKSVDEMIESFKKSDANQLKGGLNFIKSAGLLDELRLKDWAKFAKGYNGAGYEANKYDTKLKEAYELA